MGGCGGGMDNGRRFPEFLRVDNMENGRAFIYEINRENRSARVSVAGEVPNRVLAEHVISYGADNIPKDENKIMSDLYNGCISGGRE